MGDVRIRQDLYGHDEAYARAMEAPRLPRVAELRQEHAPPQKMQSGPPRTPAALPQRTLHGAARKAPAQLLASDGVAAAAGTPAVVGERTFHGAESCTATER